MQEVSCHSSAVVSKSLRYTGRAEEAMVLMLLDMCHWLHRWYWKGGRLDTDPLATQYTSAMLEGIVLHEDAARGRALTRPGPIGLRLNRAEQQGSVGPAKPKRIAHGDAKPRRASRIGNVVEVALWVGVLIVDGGRDYPITQCQQSENGLYGPSSP